MSVICSSIWYSNYCCQHLFQTAQGGNQGGGGGGAGFLAEHDVNAETFDEVIFEDEHRRVKKDINSCFGRNWSKPKLVLDDVIQTLLEIW